MPEPTAGTPKADRARRRRREKVQRAAAEALLKLRRRDPPSPYRRPGEESSPVGPGEPLLRPLPTPGGLGLVKGREQHTPPRHHEEVFHASFLRSFARLGLWLWGALRFIGGLLWDRLRRRDSDERRAVRLREICETMGTTFIKFGQQLSMRLDLLPYVYTRELEKMLDRVPPFPAAEAVATIERTTGRPLDETFSAFDPNPIGSASIACVFQAVLVSGERVAVKVRRPGIGDLLAADMRALSWMLTLGEFFLLPPGFTSNFLFELRSMLLEELNFVREARFTELFRRALKKARQLRYASAPKVYSEPSGNAVLVTEFVTGVWLNEVLTAIETHDEPALARLEGMGIDPLILSRRLLLISRFGNFEHIFFHADLHPANILIQPGNRIVLIDFGSCGSFTKKELIVWRRLFDAQSLDDIGAMVQAALAVLEPIPPIDRDEFAQRLEAVFWNDFYAIKSKKSEWWERISARIWISFLKLAREFQIPMRLNTLRMIRAIMLADTIAARLDHDIDPYREYRFYEKGAGKRARKRLHKRLRRLSGRGKFVRLEQGVESALNLVYQVQRGLSSLASIRVLPLIGKAAYAVYYVAKWLFMVGGVASVAALLIQFRFFGLEPESPDMRFFEILGRQVLASGWFHLFALVMSISSARRIAYRVRDRDL